MSSPDSAPAGVIHNIGYRGYDGERLSRRAITLALYTHGLRGAFGLGRAARSKVIPMGMAVVMLLPAVVLAVVAVVGEQMGQLSGPVVPYTRYAMILQAALAIFVAVAAPQSVSLDLRFHSLPLYLARPLARADYVRAKLTALTTAVFLLLAAPLLVMYLGSLAAGFDAASETADVAQALLGALLYAAVLSSVSLVIASLTSRRGFGIAAIVTVLVLSYSIVSSMQGVIAFDADDPTTAGWVGLFSPMTLVDGVQVWAFGVTTSTPAGPPNDLAGAAFLLTSLAVVALGYVVLNRRYRKVKV
ncbi:ABC transporter permease [Isoptericola halotolerans]|uniref:ABC-2 type transport system permease protein n=1 Tax=Isoptericola halotolerans TaxID=300560 RepID=A0ABX2A8B9_9MICO|nr:ABC transporter permease [Isoptericola halotolerans]NOV99097.1 ABC-2 type transport system permease protein [Isoptericola halotolerans]